MAPKHESGLEVGLRHVLPGLSWKVLELAGHGRTSATGIASSGRSDRVTDASRCVADGNVVHSAGSESNLEAVSRYSLTLG